MNPTVRPGPVRHDGEVAPHLPPSELLGPRAVVIVFLTFALPYFLSALLRAITATLSPTLSAEMSLNAGDLGLLAGGYFFGFALNKIGFAHFTSRYNTVFCETHYFRSHR